MIFILKTCENCNTKYSYDKKYCPNCGIKNNDFHDEGDLLKSIQDDVDSSNFYESKVDDKLEELDVLTLGEKLGFKIGDIKGKFKSNLSEEEEPKQSEHTNSIICPQCDTENNLSSRFCGECGFPLKNLRICPSCGNICENDDFCDKCGSAMKDIKVCPSCNHIMEFDAKFCGNCGNTF